MGDLRGGSTVAGNPIWHTGNQGSGSGLDADLLDGKHAASTATADTIVLRDGSNNINATTFTGALSGNAATATKLAATKTIGASGDATGTATAFDGSANITIPLTLASSGVTAGTYKSVTVDSKGRVTAGTNLTAGDIPTIPSTQVSGLGTAATKNTGTTSGTVPILDGNGKLDTSILPAIAITDTTVVANQAAMLALTAQIGDVAVRSDITKSFILKADPASTLANWQELLTPTDTVLSVAGKTGAVSLTSSDVGLGNVANESKATMFTSPALTGTPTSPTATAGTNTTQIATTAFVTGAISTSAGTKADLAHTHSLTVNGDATGSVTLDNTADTLSLTLANSGVSANTYKSVTVDAKGRVTAGTNPTTLSGYGITDVKPGVVSTSLNPTQYVAVRAAGRTAGMYYEFWDSGVDWAGIHAGPITAHGSLTAETQLISSVATGVAPLSVASTTLVSNLNADMLDGKHASEFLSTTSGTLTNPLTITSTTSSQLILDNGSNQEASIHLKRSAAGQHDWKIKNYSGDFILSKDVGDDIFADIFRIPYNEYNAYINGNKVWHAGNDGAGSGLDADLLDGLNSAAFVRTHSGSETHSGVDLNTLYTPGFYRGNGYINAPNSDAGWFYIVVESYTDTAWGKQTATAFNSGGSAVEAATFIRTKLNGTWGSWHKVWTDNTDGTGSGLDADVLDGMQPASANTVSTVVSRDSSGNFSAGTITAALTGNASTATTLQNSRTINGVSFNGSANITVEPYIEDDEGTNATRYLVFTDDSTAGHKRLNEDSSLQYNPSTGSLTMNGTLSAAAKSFLIKHPTKEGMKLRHGSLEGPENGVYIRGTLKDDNTIELPEYWTKLVDVNTITVQLTPIGNHQKLYIKDISIDKVTVGNKAFFNRKINCSYMIFAERIDIAKLEVEVEV